MPVAPDEDEDRAEVEPEQDPMTAEAMAEEEPDGDVPDDTDGRYCSYRRRCDSLFRYASLVLFSDGTRLDFQVAQHVLHVEVWRCWRATCRAQWVWSSSRNFFFSEHSSVAPSTRPLWPCQCS